ncbi:MULTISPECIES: NusG domain II-containing protein [Blautia]|uniref:NusG domain II-containing protein n=1 Tax=Blautia TaxID=572511 RepID=UPI00156F2D79|nr:MULTISPECIES: NusG domain II-containing protein [Blautia]MCB5474411.1 NusG domain II-containing protein [Blautia luti]NSK77727.1 NusG domain II-containing protein [Blautia massiliensis (ex Durand et al. 2017)]
MKKKETIFIASILVIAGILWLGFRISGQRSHNTIRITVDGKEFGTYSLSKNQVIHIGDTNVCEIKDGKVTMIEATCPDHYCMKQKAVDEHGGSIICLPNKVVIEGKDSAEPSESDDSPKIDAVT